MKNRQNLAIVACALFLLAIGCTAPQPRDKGLVDNQSNTANALKNTWEYSESADPMTSQTVTKARLRSTNTLNFNFPYHGGSFGELLIRKKDGKEEVLVGVSKGQINNSAQQKIRIRYDDKPSLSYSYDKPSDGSSDLIFLSDPKSVIFEIKKSSSIKVEIEFYREGNRILEFDTKDLKW